MAQRRSSAFRQFGLWRTQWPISLSTRIPEDRIHGASIHGLPALRRVPGNSWLDVAMIRMNHTGKSMDTEDCATQGLGSVPEVVSHVQQVRKQGLGVISMKLAGEGAFEREDRRRAMRFAFRQAGVDCVAVGYKSPAEIDKVVENLNLALTS